MLHTKNLQIFTKNTLMCVALQELLKSTPSFKTSWYLRTAMGIHPVFLGTDHINIQVNN